MADTVPAVARTNDDAATSSSAQKWSKLQSAISTVESHAERLNLT